MKVVRWDPELPKELIEKATEEQFDEAAEYVAAQVRRHLARVIKGNISRPVYRRGPYAGEPWTARQAGMLMKSIRVVRGKVKHGRMALKAGDVRVYAGHYLAWYASIVEHYTPFMRPAFYASLARVKQILGAK